MRRDCEIVAQDWDGIIPALLAHKYDAVVASLNVTKTAKKWSPSRTRITVRRGFVVPARAPM